MFHRGADASALEPERELSASFFLKNKDIAET
jgi:hypothetical protein